MCIQLTVSVSYMTLYFVHPLFRLVNGTSQCNVRDRLCERYRFSVNFHSCETKGRILQIGVPEIVYSKHTAHKRLARRSKCPGKQSFARTSCPPAERIDGCTETLCITSLTRHVVAGLVCISRKVLNYKITPELIC